MAKFTVRVELRGSVADLYLMLDQTMAAAGFRRLISGLDASGASGWWQLPTGEYDIEIEETAQQVRDRAKILADSVKQGSWILVTQVADRSWNTNKVQS